MADGVYKVTAYLHNEKGHHWQNVWHYSVVNSHADDTKFATALALADAWESTIKTTFLACMGADTTLDVVTAMCVDPPPGTTATSISGEVSGAAVEGVSAAIGADVEWIDGGDTGRFARTFLANPMAGWIQGDRVAAAYIAKIDLWAAQMVAELPLGGAQGSASFVHYVVKTKARFAIAAANVQDKITALNKRTVPNL